MKPKSFGLALALGLVAALFACQDLGMVAPDILEPQFAAKKCEKDPTLPGCTPDPDPPPPDPEPEWPTPNANVDWNGGLVGTGRGAVTEDTRRMLKATAPRYVRMNFTETQKLFTGAITLANLPQQCTVTEDVTDAKLVELHGFLVASSLLAYPASRFEADLTRDVSSKNRIGFNYRAPDFDYFHWVKKSKLTPEHGSPAVQVLDNGKTATLEFRGGSVIVTQSSFSPSEPQYTLACQNMDVITVTVVRD